MKLSSRDTSRRWVFAAFLMAVLLLLPVGWVALPDALVRRLEQAYWPPADGPDKYVGIIVLGGALTPYGRWHPPSKVTRNEASERVTVPAELMQRHAHLRLLYAGREEDAVMPDGSKTPAARLVMMRLGVDQQRVEYEAMSRNTYENATFSAKLVGTRKDSPWLLVTSARHMPRAFATFRAAGWNVTPYPVDYVRATVRPWTEYSWARGLAQWREVLHEYAGLVIYAVTGRAYASIPALPPGTPKSLPPSL